MRRGHRHCVLLVDEEGPARNVVRDLLAGAGMEVMSARHGRAALQILTLGIRPCVIVVDVLKPAVAGAEFRRAQQYDPALRDIPVIVLSDATGPLFLDADRVRARAAQYCWTGVALRREPTRSCARVVRPPRSHRRERKNGT